MITSILLDSEVKRHIHGHLRFDDLPSTELLEAFKRMGFIGTISWFSNGIEFHAGGIDSLFNDEII